MLNEPTKKELIELIEELARQLLWRDNIGKYIGYGGNKFRNEKKLTSLATRVNTVLAIEGEHDTDEKYPEPEDDEGYAQAVEYDDARRWLELTSGATRDQTDEPGPLINTDEIPL